MICTAQEIRDQSEKLISTTDVPNVQIEERILNAEGIVKAKLGKLITPDEIDAIGAESNVIKNLVMFKATEKTLAKKYGATRKVDEVSDIQYWQKEFKDLLESVLNGDVPIDKPDSSDAAGVSIPKSYPKLSGKTNNSKFYPR